MAQKRQFNFVSEKKEKIDQLVKKPTNEPKEVNINGAYNFSSGQYKTNDLNTTNPPTRKKQGRPIVVTDPRYKVSRPKKIAPALESKLACLQSYMTEFADENKRISFNKLVDTLADSYIETKLGADIKKSLKEKIEKEFRNLKV
ncbi:hypothetical protein JG29_15920 [Bombilactobacillus mellis]|uniref:Uncharacterized protein n=1 Tax=Bombilactobacillus mellis TaxID=1218508 RepID=A0A0F4KN42_9LACO|nr:hypothetical protein [Bombilactobacillus mellis]KJY48077.1 hypothetical protein JG29_15920 [Bombilactobacillus mellis]